MKSQMGPSHVVVITGASSGIGRELSLELARSQVQLVLLARSLNNLNAVASLCRELGSPTDIHAVDVTDAGLVEKLADEVFRLKGRLDVWVNNAGVGAIGSFTKIPLADHARVMQTNFFGYLNGSYAALKVFERQGRGILINNASISSHLIVPHSASYNSSKHAIRALTLSLREDLLVDGRKNIHVCLINPEVVDTPAFHHAANYSGVPIRIKLPMVTASDVAKRMVKLMRKPRREVFVGKLGRFGVWANKFFPPLSAAFLRWGAQQFYKVDPSQKPTVKAGSLHGTNADGPRSDGGWKSGATDKI